MRRWVIPAACLFLVLVDLHADGAYLSGAVTPATGLTAAGSSQSTALVLTTYENYVSTVAPGTGVQISQTLMTAGYRDILIVNEGTNPLTVWPASGDTINALGANVQGPAIAPGTAMLLKVKSPSALRTIP
jgi:hypothetical protein